MYANEITSDERFLLWPRPAFEFSFQLECLVSRLNLRMPNKRNGSASGGVSAVGAVHVLCVAKLEILRHADID